MLAYESPGVSINTDLVKPDEITYWNDLLAPKWKGKIIMPDPALPSAASTWFFWTTEALGKDFMYSLVKQEPRVIRDERLVSEWLAQAKYPVALAVPYTKLAEFLHAGAHIGFVKPSDYHALANGSGLLSLMNKAPHPNAAKVFINWLFTKEGQTLLSQAQDAQSRRVDVPTDKLSLAGLRNPSFKYLEETVETTRRQGQSMKLAGEIFGPLSGR